MTCARYRQLISRYIDGEVTSRQRGELLEHVEGCHDCSLWLARARQTDVLLKGGAPETRPSDRVRDAVLGSLKSQPRQVQSSKFKVQSPPKPAIRNPRSAIRRLGWVASELLLRFDPSPKRVALAAATSIFTLIGLAYWLNILPPLGGYKELGFLVPGEDSPAAVNATPLVAVSSGKNGVGGPVAVPNPLRISPTDNTRDIPLTSPIGVRFDQPMDRTSVEGAWQLDPPTAGAFAWDADNEVRFAAYEPGLLRGITYTVILSSTARSLTGTPLRQPLQWSFRTKEPYSVLPGNSLGATMPLTGTFSLSFETPMDREDTHLSLHAASGEDLPLAIQWDAGGRKAVLFPKLPMPEGTVYLRAGATSRTQAGDTLGQPYEFAYRVAPPKFGLRLLGGRLIIAEAGSKEGVRYEVSTALKPTPTQAAMLAHLPDEDLNSRPALTFSLYALPTEQVAALGAQAQERPWPMPAPDALLSNNPPVQTFSYVASGGEGSAPLPHTLQAGAYLLTASTLADTGVLTDWQIVVVADHHLTKAGENAPLFWATDEEGRAWAKAEVVLYAPGGETLARGLTDGRGLWSPDVPRQAANLAVARDAGGHLAAMLLDPQANSEKRPTDNLAATLRTDREEYYPGGSVNFRLLLNPTPYTSLYAQATPLAEQEVNVALVTPGGNMLSSLTLKPDEVGGVSGAFNLSSHLRPGAYTLLARSGGEERRFTLSIKQPPSDTLSVYILPESPDSDPTHAITRTVSVLGTGGAPPSGATLTATLRIAGDAWASKPVTATLNSNGQATLVLPLPSWTASYNDPGLYIDAQATWNDLRGEDSQYLDLTTEGATQAGMQQMVSPALNLAAVALPTKSGSINVRLVTLGGGVEGDVLLVARTASGEWEASSLDMAGAGDDITVPLSRRYAGGSLRLLRSGVEGYREVQLLPSRSGGMELQVAAPATTMPNAPVMLTLGLVDKEGQGLAGVAGIRFRRVAGEAIPGGRDETQGWEPDATLLAGGTVSTTVQAPSAPGLWYVMAEAAASDGGKAQTWAVLRVLPGPSIQMPVSLRTKEMEPQAVSVRLHNPSDQAVSAGISLSGDGSLKAMGNSAQSVSLAPGESRRMEWRVRATQQGAHTALFSLTTDGEAAGAWSLDVVAAEGPRTSVTYASGVLSGERTVGVLVPSGLAPQGVELQVRASLHLLPTLASIASDLGSDYPSRNNRAMAAAARLSSGAAVEWAYSRAYTQTVQTPPDPNSLRSEGANLLEQIYAAQHADGSWSAEYAPDDAPGSITGTAHVLLALRRYEIASPAEGQGQGPQLSIDVDVVQRGLAYLTSEVTRPIGERPTTAMLDERTYGLYALSLHAGTLQPELVRPYILFTSPGRANQAELSQAGQAWLALALMRTGATHDGLLLVDRLMRDQEKMEARAAAPMLEALLEASRAAAQAKPPLGAKAASRYMGAAPNYVRLLMEARQGLGWSNHAETADALWSLLNYAAQAGDEGEAATTGSPALTLNDHPVQLPRANPGGNRDDGDNAASLSIPGSELHPGTNWLKLKAPTTGQPLYYSLTLKATR